MPCICARPVAITQRWLHRCCYSVTRKVLQSVTQRGSQLFTHIFLPMIYWVCKPNQQFCHFGHAIVGEYNSIYTISHIFTRLTCCPPYCMAYWSADAPIHAACGWPKAASCSGRLGGAVASRPSWLYLQTKHTAPGVHGGKQRGQIILSICVGPLSQWRVRPVSLCGVRLKCILRSDYCKVMDMAPSNNSNSICFTNSEGQETRT